MFNQKFHNFFAQTPGSEMNRGISILTQINKIKQRKENEIIFDILQQTTPLFPLNSLQWNKNQKTKQNNQTIKQSKKDENKNFVLKVNICPMFNQNFHSRF